MQFLKLTACVAVAAFVALSGGAVAAQVIEVINAGRFARITGEIGADGADRLERFLNQNPQVVAIQLNSPGGQVVSSLQMATVINTRRLGTYVRPGETCASACALLFFAGHDRLLEGRLGLHQLDDGGRTNASILQFVLADQIDAFLSYGVPWDIIQRMLTTPPTQMYWISSEDARALELNRDLSDDDGSGGTRDAAMGGASFGDFPADSIFIGTPHAPDFEGRDADYRNFRTRIANGIVAGANFAGYFTIVEIGCGTSCRFAVVVNLETGAVQSFPYGGEDYYGMSLLYLAQSRMLRVKWLSDWQTPSCTEQDMLFDGENWEVIAERSTLAQGDYCA